MKIQRILTLTAAAALMLAVLGGCMGLPIKPADDGEPKEEITSFEQMTITISGTSAETEVYEILKTDEGARISYYRGPWMYDDDMDREECLQKRVDGGQELVDTLLYIFTECRILKWDGFHGTNDQVLDGDSYTLEAVVNDGRTISCSGCNAYPDHYGSLMRAINAQLTIGMEESSES